VMKVELAYARSVAEQVVLGVEVVEGTTIRGVIAASGVMDHYPEIDLSINGVGIYGMRRDLDMVVHGGDRVEIYRPLLIDPKQARRLRARKRGV